MNIDKLIEDAVNKIHSELDIELIKNRINNIDDVVIVWSYTSTSVGATIMAKWEAEYDR